jgi:spore coat polysaccharide biosynthesis protein SpsF
MAGKTVCIIQARMGSTRLPGKVLKPLLGKPMLWWVVQRVRKARYLDEVVVATTALDRDDTLADFCREQDIPCYRGSEDDVLDRYYQAARKFHATHIVRITSDCPLIDPGVIDCVAAAFFSAGPRVDYASNITTRTYPRGLDTEVFSNAVLAQAWREDQSAWREHVTPYIHQQPEKFRLLEVSNRVDFSRFRWTVDTPEDFALIEQIYGAFGNGDFDWQEALIEMEAHVDWAAINAHIEQKKL